MPSSYVINLDTGEDILKETYAQPGTISDEVYRVNNSTLQTSYTTAAESGLATQLKSNLQVFSVFKAHRVAKELQGFLVNEDGTGATFQQFKEKAFPLLGKYNKNYLHTEFQTAKARGRTAKQFDDAINEDGAANLEWLPSRSAVPRVDHKAYWHVVKPANSAFWATHYPGNEYNCKCDIQQTSAPATNAPKAKAAAVAGIDQNPYTVKKIFTNTHPYLSGTTEAERRNIMKFVKEKNVSMAHEVTSHYLAQKYLTKAADFGRFKGVAKWQGNVTFADNSSGIIYLPKNDLVTLQEAINEANAGGTFTEQQDVVVRNVWVKTQALRSKPDAATSLGVKVKNIANAMLAMSKKEEGQPAHYLSLVCEVIAFYTAGRMYKKFGYKKGTEYKDSRKNLKTFKNALAFIRRTQAQGIQRQDLVFALQKGLPNNTVYEQENTLKDALSVWIKSDKLIKSIIDGKANN